MRDVIVTGGRHYDDRDKVWAVLNLLKPEVVIQGGATGADALAKAWAKAQGVGVVQHDADWKTYGYAAGPRRNVEMLEAHPDAVVVAFLGGDGTANCVRNALRLKRLVLRVES